MPATWRRLNVAACRIVIRADRKVPSAEGVVLACESRDFITSLSPDSVTCAELCDYIHGRGEAANCLHVIKASLVGR